VLFGCRFAQPDRPHGLCPSHPLDGAGAVQETKPPRYVIGNCFESGSSDRCS
jgi:hypothetical protein